MKRQIIKLLNSQIVFAAITPHPPIILPTVGSPKDRARIKNTIEALEKLGKKLKEVEPDLIIISSPHPDWGFDVPLYFLSKDFKGDIKRYLIGLEPPQFYFEKGKEVYRGLTPVRMALIASGDMSHCLKEDGSYGFHPDGPKFDKAFIKYLKEKNIENLLRLNMYFSEAAECGLRSFCFLLGILETSKINWQAKIVSYEGPFGVGYLVADLKLQN